MSDDADLAGAVVDARITPRDLFERVAAEYGGFTVDVAAHASNAQLRRYFDRAEDGLAQSWAGERVWCNPPYSDIAAWVAKAAREHDAGCPLIVMLLPANRTEQRWWQDLVEPHRDGRGPIECRFIRRRVHFGRADSTVAQAPFASCLLIWRRP